jgi:hypothetical protein
MAETDPKDTDFPLEIKVIIEYKSKGVVKKKSYEPDIPKGNNLENLKTSAKEFSLTGYFGGCFVSRKYELKSDLIYNLRKTRTCTYRQEVPSGSGVLESMANLITG